MNQLIFDFDGTIVDSGPLIYKHLAAYAPECNMSWNELRELPSNEVVSTLGIKKLDLPKLIVQIRADFKKHLKEQPIAPGMYDALVTLKERGFKLRIVSSNSEENVRAFLSNQGLGEAFENVTSFFTIFGKASGIRKLLSEEGLSASDSIYIGDETRDIQAAEKAGIKSLAVTWGYNSEKPLAEYRPTFMAKSPNEMVDLLCKDLH